MSYVGCTTKGCYWMVCPDAALSSLQLVKLRKKSAFVGAEQSFLCQNRCTFVGENSLFLFTNLQTTSLRWFCFGS